MVQKPDSVQTARKDTQPLPSQMPPQLSAHSLDKIPNTEVLQWTSLPSITIITRKAQLRWAGPVSRMHNNCIPTQLFYGELCHGKRTVGGQRKRFKDSLKFCLKTLISALSPGSHSPTGATSSPKEPSQRKTTEPSNQSRKEPHARPELLALHRHQPTTARLVGKASSPGLASSATFGHTVAALLTDYALSHLRQRRTNNNKHHKPRSDETHR